MPGFPTFKIFSLVICNCGITIRNKKPEGRLPDFQLFDFKICGLGISLCHCFVNVNPPTTYVEEPVKRR